VLNISIHPYTIALRGENIMPLPMTRQEARDFRAGTHYGYDPYEKRYLDTIRNFEELPHCIHFYYMGFDGAKEDYRHYFFDNANDAIPYTDVPSIMEKLARNAVLKDYNPPKHGNSFDDIVWRRRCYLAVVMNSDIFSFWEDAAIRFVQKNNSKENMSFFDADDFPIDIAKPGGGTVRRTGFFCINHMKRDSYGHNLLPTDKRYHSFELVFRIGGGQQPWYYDPGGTNQGPPETP
jgi:hypothetical protein